MKEEISSYADEGQERDAVNLYPDMTYQVFEGFGGALTEAAAYTWHQMGDKNKKMCIRDRGWTSRENPLSGTGRSSPPVLIL